MSWATLPFEIQSAVLKEIARVPSYIPRCGEVPIWNHYLYDRGSHSDDELGDDEVSDDDDGGGGDHDHDHDHDDDDDDDDEEEEEEEQISDAAEEWYGRRETDNGRELVKLVAEWKDVQRCLEVCRLWNETVRSLLCLYAPISVVIRFGSESLATAAISHWIETSSKRKEAGRQNYWDMGQEDLLWQAIRRGFTGCMRSLLDQVPREKLLDLWEKEELCKGLYPHTAAREGKLESLQVLNEYGLSLDEHDDGDRTPFMFAVSNNHARVVDYLISIGADQRISIPLYGPHGPVGQLSPLQYAARRGTVEVVEVLLQHSAHEIEGPDDEHQSPALQFALRRTDHPTCDEIARRLLSYTMPPDIYTLGSDLIEEGQFSLHYAVMNRFPLDVIRGLFELGVQLSSPDMDMWFAPLDTAVKNGDADIINLLLEKGAGCSQQAIDTAHNRGEHKLADTLLPRCKNISIATYAITGKADLVKWYLAHGKEPNPISPEGRLLARVAQKGDLDMCKLLVEAGANVNEPAGLEWTPLCNAIELEHLEMIKYLLAQGAKVNVRNGNALHTAVLVCNPSLVKVMLEHGADVNEAADSTTPLLEAANNEHLEIAQILLAHGADPNKPTGKYGTALHECAAGNILKIAELLLANGADVNKDIPTHGTPLHLAADIGTPEMMKLLLQHGADVNAQTGYHGRTLHAAIASGSYEGVKLLLDHGVDLELRGSDQSSALAKAREYWDVGMANPGVVMTEARLNRKRICDLIESTFKEKGLPIE